ncbi:MAG: hypothetical protein H3C47_14695 [Candidatus Cloacimonetes bacterium]|nr:hypothetical protein [Candidatus Cloacimonadota bacterium]
MNLWEIHKSYVNAKRFQEIAYVFAKYGFSDILERIGLEAASALGLGRGLLSNKEKNSLARSRRLKLALEELGPTFIKLGQILSTRKDLLPTDYIQELRKLQEEVTPVPKETIESILLQSLQVQTLEDIFLTFDFNPVATASIAQVHRASLKNGSMVIVKIQKPNIHETIRTDLNILSYLSRLLQEQLEPEYSADWAGILTNFIEGILKELDFMREARMMARFASISDAQVRIPAVFFEYSGASVLVQEYVPGIRIQDKTALLKASLKPEILGEHLVTTFFKQVFEEGCFHGDPHPGNIRIHENGCLIFYDFGMVGQLDTRTLYHMTRVFYAAGNGDYALMARSLCIICSGSISGTEPMLETNLKDLVLTYKSLPLKDIKLQNFLHSLDHLLLSHNLRMPGELSILLKAILTLESSVRELNPDIQLLDFLLPNFEVLIQKQFTKEAIFTRSQSWLHLGLDYLSELHGDLFLMLKQQKRIQVETLARSRKIDMFAYRIEKLVYRGILGLVIASALIGSSILIATGKDAASLPFFLGLFGWFCAFVFAAILVYNILTVNQPGKE